MARFYQVWATVRSTILSLTSSLAPFCGHGAGHYRGYHLVVCRMIGGHPRFLCPLHNNPIGLVPVELGNLTALKSLDMRSNQLSGESNFYAVSDAAVQNRHLL